MYELSAALFTAVTGETAIFLTFQKHLLLAENECAFTIIQSVVFVQTNAKIHPHKPVLNNIIIYTSDSSLFFKSSVVRFFILQLIIFFVKTCISMVNELVFRGLQH